MNSINTHSVVLLSNYKLNFPYLFLTSQILRFRHVERQQSAFIIVHIGLLLVLYLTPPSQIPRVKVPPVGRANARESDNSHNNNNNNNTNNSQLRSSVTTTRTQNRLSMFQRIHARMSWVSLNVGAPRSVFQAETVAGGRTGVDMKVWSHGPYKCAVIVRIQKSHHLSSFCFRC